MYGCSVFIIDMIIWYRYIDRFDLCGPLSLYRLFGMELHISYLLYIMIMIIVIIIVNILIITCTVIIITIIIVIIITAQIKESGYFELLFDFNFWVLNHTAVKKK